MRIGCVVVTYNRKKLLIECLNAIYRQTVPVDLVILIDNASTDGTKDELNSHGFMEKESFHYNCMDSNLGGSGGFYEGLKRVDNSMDWVWIMDDDTIPENDCLEKLLNATSMVNNASFFASMVFGPQKDPMNIPSIDFRLTENGYPDWYFELNNKMVKIQNATFVSLLINMKAIEKCGLPCKDYFIWGDDTEYTTRLTTYYGPAYMVGDSVVCHKRVGAKALAITNESDSKRIANYFYYYRNFLINTYIYQGKKEGKKFATKTFLFSLKLLPKKNGLLKAKTVLKAIWFAKHQWKDFDHYISLQIDN